MTWQAAIDALRSRDFSVSENIFTVPTVACVERALAWMEARAQQEPMRWPTCIAESPDGGIVIDFRKDKELYLSVEFENDGNTEWMEWRDGKIIASGTIPNQFIDPLPTTYQPRTAKECG